MRYEINEDDPMTSEPDGSFDSQLSPGAAAMLAALEKYMTDHPEMAQGGRKPPSASGVPVSRQVKIYSA